ncbi:MAG: capsular biosynthesis protein [Crocinitomicaceae bacterium]|nr:capsular biosynthesis protein [Crocinitomicaceae bacterium]
MSFLNKIIRKKKEAEELFSDLGLIGVDMHSHFIPGIDDGAQKIEQSVSLIRAMKEFGYRKVITTPHVYTDLYPNTSEIILEGLKKVKDELLQQHIEMEVAAAAEYYSDENFETLIDQKKLLSFGKNYVLFEISFMDEPPNLGRIIFNLQAQGYKPVLAHPERYEYWNGNFDKYESLADKDVFLQLNINSLTGNYGSDVKRTSEKLIDAGLISFIGSDCHHDGHLTLMHSARKSAALNKLIRSGKLLNNSL